MGDMNASSNTSEAATGTKKLAVVPMNRHEFLEALGNKRDVGALAGGMSVRWVDSQLAVGMPHLKLGARRVRFDLGEVRTWLKNRYGQQRRGPARPAPAKAELPEGGLQ